MFVFNLVDSDTMGWCWYSFVYAHVHTPQPPTQSTTGALLTTALREEQQQQLHGAGTGAAEPCDVRIVGATSLFVPGLPTPQIGGPTAVVPPAGSRVAVEDAEGLARVFGFGGIKGLQQQERDGVRAAAAAASVELLTDDGAATVAVRPGEPAGGVRVAVSTRTKPNQNSTPNSTTTPHTTNRPHIHVAPLRLPPATIPDGAPADGRRAPRRRRRGHDGWDRGPLRLAARCGDGRAGVGVDGGKARSPR